MKKLPEHSPKASAWEDLLKKGEFESQLSDHLSMLPQFAPQEAAWEKITAELDRKKVVPIWIRWSAAAAVATILLLATILADKSGEEIQGQKLVADKSNERAKAENENGTFESQKPAEIVTENTGNISNRTAPKKKIKRSIELIEVPKVTLPEIALSQSKNLSLEMPERQVLESTPPKTLHQVSISWSKIKPGLQVKTSFGRMESELGQKPQASAHHVGQLTVEIDN